MTQQEAINLLMAEYQDYFAARAFSDGMEKAAMHFRNLTRILWPPDEQGRGGYIWLSEEGNIPPESCWNDLALMALLQNRHVGMTGPASSAKSELMGIWGLVNWIPLYDRCFVLVASVTIAGAKKRVWSSIKERFKKIEWLGIGKYVEHPQPMILANRGDAATRHLSDRCSISLVAPDAGKEGDAIGKLIGIKQEHFIVLADELDDMSSAITNADSNWSKNPDYQFVGATNINSALGTFGNFFAPKDGWESLSVDTVQWETKTGGIGLHFDGMRSPNFFTRPVDKYPFLYKTTDYTSDCQNLGETTARFWRMARGWISPTGDEDNLYSEMELIQQGCMERAKWTAPPTQLAALDPNYSKLRGDQCLAKFGAIGIDNENKKTIDMGGPENEIALREDVRIDDTSSTKQKAMKFVQLCHEREINVRQVVIDCTGGGSLMADAVEDAFGQKGVLRVEFGGSPSEMVVEKQGDLEITAKDKYADMATQLWHVGIGFVKSRQIRGLTSKQVQQMSRRKVVDGGAGGKKKIKIEPKPSYKMRTQLPSPDEGDGGFLLLHLGIERFNLIPQSQMTVAASQDWSRAFSRFRPAPNKPDSEQRLVWQR